MTAAQLDLRGISKRFGGFTALSDVSMAIRKGERIGLIGPNGSGKTTLMSCISGSLFVNEGSIHFGERDISQVPAHRRARLGIARSFQIPRPFRSMTVLENLLVPLEYVAERGTFRGAGARDKAMAILKDMGLASKADKPSGNMTQVELRKLELARAMAANPQLLICDESMAGLSTMEVEEVLDILFRLNGEGITVIMIEHIMQAVMRFSQRLFCLEAGKLICEGTPTEVVANPHVQRAYLGT